jgi:Tfp pilus assembly PilM family ATPase
MMLSFLKRKVFPIGVDMGSETLKMAQLVQDSDGLRVIAGTKDDLPPDVKLGTSQWQHWVIKTIRQMISQGTFKGRKVITAVPVDEVFIDQIKIPRTPDEKLKDAVLGKIAGKLPFESKDALVQFVVTNAAAETDVLVMATERTKVDRHLAIYEKAGLQIQAICVWPLAMVSGYINFFGRRQSDMNVTVMLLEVGANFTKVAICRHKNLLFARLLPIGIKHLVSEEIVKRLVQELVSCARYFEGATKGAHIDRLIFLAGHSTDRDLCQNIVQLAQHLHVPAQIGDVLAAVEMTEPGKSFERRGSNVNWTSSFGLSLSQ